MKSVSYAASGGHFRTPRHPQSNDQDQDQYGGNSERNQLKKTEHNVIHSHPEIMMLAEGLVDITFRLCPLGGARARGGFHCPWPS
jgi:hypothetical protein